MPTALTVAFDAAMDGLGPYEPRPAIAVAVSGGADSMALAILSEAWVRQRGGTVRALVVDHGLRAASAHEARLTIERLAGIGIPAQLLSISDLHSGSALAERARIMRYQVLTDACAKAGILHLLLGHQAADQRETLVMRVLTGSRTHGLAGMSALRETAFLRVLRPLLRIEPPDLRQFLASRGMGWIEDPSNLDRRAMRVRVRQGLATVARVSSDSLGDAVSSTGRLRRQEEINGAAELAQRATLHPEGFALLSPGRIGIAAFRGLVQMIGGRHYPPGSAQIAELAAQPRPATLAGVRLLAAGRHGDGLLVVREEAAIGKPVAAVTAAVWDHRFRVVECQPMTHTAMIGKLGADAPRFRRLSDLPAAVLRTLPAIWIGNTLASVPHLEYVLHENNLRTKVLFTPPKPIAGLSFVCAA